VLQGVMPFNLNVALPGDTSSDTSSVDIFVGKIVVMLELTSPQASPGADPMEAPDGARLIERQPGQKRFKITFEDGHVEYRTFPTGGDGRQRAATARRRTIRVDGGAATITTNSEGTRTLRYVHGDYTVTSDAQPGVGGPWGPSPCRRGAGPGSRR
jgi:hypothetical protein